MGDMLEVTQIAAGVLGASQAIGTDLASLNNPGPGRFMITGTVRHSLADGCRLLIGSTTVLSVIPAAAGVAKDFGPVVYDIKNTTDDITLELLVATGASDSAAGVLYIQRLDTM